MIFQIVPSWCLFLPVCIYSEPLVRHSGARPMQIRLLAPCCVERSAELVSLTSFDCIPPGYVCCCHLYISSQRFQCKKISGMTSRMTRKRASGFRQWNLGGFSLNIFASAAVWGKIFGGWDRFVLVNCFRRLMWLCYVKELLRSAVEKFISLYDCGPEMWHDGYFLEDEIQKFISLSVYSSSFRDKIWSADFDS